jgi:hypothetical protein
MELTTSSEQNNQGAEPMPSGLNAGNNDSTTRRSYDLLDTSLAMRIDFGRDPGGESGGPALSVEKVQEIRAMLDQAIVSTKAIIGTLGRTATRIAEFLAPRSNHYA